MMVDADQGVGLECVGGLFDRFALYCRDECLAGVQMTGGLVEPQSFVGLFLDQQEPAGLLHYGRHGDMGLPDVRDAHRAILAVGRAEP